MAARHSMLLVLLATLAPAAALRLPPTGRPATASRVTVRRVPRAVCCQEEPSGEIVRSGDIVDAEVVEGTTSKLTAAEVEQVGNLAADDEWLGLAMELGIVLRSAVRESVKASVRDFTGNNDYKIGDLSKEADARVKDAVAQMRGKD
eukprot:1263418-Prymnesium_polylepis.1